MDLHSFLDIDNAFVKSGGLPSSSVSSHFGDPISAHFAKHLPASNGASTLGDVPVDLWPADTGYRLPESWSQTIGSLLSISECYLHGWISSSGLTSERWSSPSWEFFRYHPFSLGGIVVAVYVDNHNHEFVCIFSLPQSLHHYFPTEASMACRGGSTAPG